MTRRYPRRLPLHSTLGADHPLPSGSRPTPPGLRRAATPGPGRTPDASPLPSEPTRPRMHSRAPQSCPPAAAPPKPKTKNQNPMPRAKKIFQVPEARPRASASFGLAALKPEKLTSRDSMCHSSVSLRPKNRLKPPVFARVAHARPWTRPRSPCSSRVRTSRCRNVTNDRRGAESQQIAVWRLLY